jgi:hypothetical protein
MSSANLQVSSERQADSRERLLIAGLAVVGTIFISAAAFMEPEPAPNITGVQVMGAHVVRDLGIALVIAAALAVAVDKYLKGKLVSSVATEVSRHVAENTSKYVFGYFVPPDMKDELLELMRPAVLRRNFKLNIGLDPLGPGHPDLVRVTTRISFTLENLKDQETSFRHALSMTSMFAAIAPPEVLRFSCRANSREAYEYDYHSIDSLLKAPEGLVS